MVVEIANTSLIKLYADIANLTFEDCKKTCRRLGSCCDDMYCEIAISFAKDEYGIVLERTGNAIPLLNSDGQCIAPPHVRPMCSYHSCDINSIGLFKNDQQRTDKYFELREKIDVLEFEKFKASHGCEDLEDWRTK